MPDAIDMTHYAVRARPVSRPATEAVMSSAIALFAAHGRATRLAMRATADWFDPPKFNLLRTLYEYAWATRECRDDLPHYRARALTALRSYRVLKAQGRAG